MRVAEAGIEDAVDKSVEGAVAETAAGVAVDTTDCESQVDAFIAREIREHGVWNPEARYNRSRGHGRSSSCRLTRFSSDGFPVHGPREVRSEMRSPASGQM